MTGFVPRQLQSLCVFCGSSPGSDPGHAAAAARLGRLLADAGVTLVYGGGHRGLMGALAEGALKADGRVVGVIPEPLMRSEAAYLEISELIVVDSMHTRKRRMFELADAFCVLPGGMGTMDEAFEILTWKQLGLHNLPVVIANLEGFWTPWLGLVDRIIESGFARPDARELFCLANTVEEVLPRAQREMTAAMTRESKLF